MSLTSRRATFAIFPAGYPHSLQGLGPDGCEFVICFDNGEASEFNTLLTTDWFIHTPPDVLAKNFGVPAETFAKIPMHDLWIFQGKVPGDLETVRQEMTGGVSAPPHPFTFSLGSAPPCAIAPLDMASVNSKAMITNFMIHAPWLLCTDAPTIKARACRKFES
jgi:hypothetical protein